MNVLPFTFNLRFTIDLATVTSTILFMNKNGSLKAKSGVWFFYKFFQTLFSQTLILEIDIHNIEFKITC